MKIEYYRNLEIGEIEEVLRQNFPNYRIDTTRNMITVAKNSWIAAVVTVRKHKILIGGNFAKMWQRFVFTFSVLLLGVLIPLIVYFLFFHKKLKLAEKEIGNVLKEKYQKS